MLPYIHPFNGPFSGTTRVSRYHKRKTNLDFTEARDSEWQWHQQDHKQVCTSLQTANHASTPPLSSNAESSEKMTDCISRLFTIKINTEGQIKQDTLLSNVSVPHT